MATQREYKEKSVLLVDDEPEYLDWLRDYLVAKGFHVETALTADDAVRIASSADFRLYLVDLNIPSGGWVPQQPALSAIYDQYKGLQVIRYVRTQSNAGARVVAYSAHENKDIHAAIDKLYCKYVVKGRARDIKSEIEDILLRDPRRP